MRKTEKLAEKYERRIAILSIVFFIFSFAFFLYKVYLTPTNLTPNMPSQVVNGVGGL